MRPEVITPAREATRRECCMHEILRDLVQEGDMVGAVACREQFVQMSLKRSDISSAELDHVAQVKS